MLYEYMKSHEMVVKKLVDHEDEGIQQVTITNAQQTPNGQYMVKDSVDREKYMVNVWGRSLHYNIL